MTRLNHIDGVAPYSGAVAVTRNSRVVTTEEAAEDPTYGRIVKECEEVSKLIKTTAPIRTDVRRYSDEPGSPFALFDVNMKPVSFSHHTGRIFCWDIG